MDLIFSVIFIIKSDVFTQKKYFKVFFKKYKFRVGIKLVGTSGWRTICCISAGLCLYSCVCVWVRGGGMAWSVGEKFQYFGMLCFSSSALLWPLKQLADFLDVSSKNSRVGPEVFLVQGYCFSYAFTIELNFFLAVRFHFLT